MHCSQKKMNSKATEVIFGCSGLDSLAIGSPNAQTEIFVVRIRFDYRWAHTQNQSDTNTARERKKTYYEFLFLFLYIYIFYKTAGCPCPPTTLGRRIVSSLKPRSRRPLAEPEPVDRAGDLGIWRIWNSSTRRPSRRLRRYV